LNSKFLLIGISHKTAPVEWREKLAVSEDRLPAILDRLRRDGLFDEAVVLSTCNRVEIYGAVREGKESAAREAVRQTLGAERNSSLPESAFYSADGADALRHLFRVAAGLESLVVGETEILGQVKRAYETARGHSCTEKLTNVVFQRALFIGKQARTATSVSEGGTSVANVAVTLAERIFGDLSKSRVLVLGAGKMAELSARHFLSQKVSRLTVVNRTLAKAEELARAFGGRAAAFQDLLPELLQADVVLCSTGSSEPVLRFPEVEDVMRRRRNRSLFLIDIAVPRDVDPAVHRLENVYLYNVDDLEALVAENIQKRRGEIDKASRLVDDKVAEFSNWYDAWRRGETAALRHAPPSGPLLSSAASLE
jgi:glutamyl-tRNA reductase